MGDGAIRCRGVRGAITVEANTAEAIGAAARELMQTLVAANGIAQDDVGGVFFTTTVDLTAEYPALGLRAMGWTDTAILCGHEMSVPHGLARCLRVMVMWNTTRAPHEIQHVYLREARQLRPDRAFETS